MNQKQKPKKNEEKLMIKQNFDTRYDMIANEHIRPIY